ncbi:MAG TPA: NAD(P)/FAD-dependent oxidoreductase [Ignavibacteriaceae bacterium]|nr:NAD(P)/FAD-dependent oxidoreductase [Ignavibacteriaceae bacterium]
MNSFHIVVIGSSEIALVCAYTAHNTYPDKKVALIINKDGNDFINRLFNSGCFNNSDNVVTVIADEVIARKNNMIRFNNGEEIVFEKLVIATGSEAIRPQIEGVEKQGVYFINKDPDYLNLVKSKAIRASNIIVFGGGYIGVMLTDELLCDGKNVALIARTNRLLPSSIDTELSDDTAKLIKKEGGRIIFKSKVKEVLGNQKISGVKLRNGEELPCDFLIICCGEKPDTTLAEIFGIVYDNDRGILVDEYQRTSDKNIFAIGECAARFDFFCGDMSDFLLSTTRIEEAKLIGSNLYSVIYNRGRLINYINERNKLRDQLKKTFTASAAGDKKQLSDSVLIYQEVNYENRNPF